MAPGPKKKNFNRRGGENIQDNKKTPKPTVESQTKDQDSNSTILNDVTGEPDVFQDKKYNKRSVTSNWTKYDEPVNDPHADTMRGKDFEVLLSYSGGSQLQLQDEKEWDEAYVNDKSIALDFQDMTSILKCIPFHKRMNLPEDIFDKSQLEKFVSYAEISKSSYISKVELPASVKPEEFTKMPETLDPDLNIIESYESDTVPENITKPFVLEEKTENIIESLASCLSLKSPVPEKIISTPEEPVENAGDDLDFLLSLSKTANTLKQEKSIVQKQTNVDDWLNSILDD
ncbi:uncharacterized protein LOC129958234 [Argiope bruennichi]|uniref:uncharacterized protein LOC129958234 n=1 Tax=Argiope bruennichi TaxID=94029 RepID=UPI002494A8E3|nr:uncharacterized protein LOC129958234 [Argiope bruennichi]